MIYFIWILHMALVRVAFKKWLKNKRYGYRLIGVKIIESVHAVSIIPFVCLPIFFFSVLASDSTYTAVLKNPFVQSVFGSALEITPQNIFKEKYFANTLFWGHKTVMQFGTETAIGGVFNFTGSAMNKVGPQINVPPAKGAAETSIYFFKLFTINWH